MRRWLWYVIIGGTAFDLLVEQEEMTFKATKDVCE